MNIIIAEDDAMCLRLITEALRGIAGKVRSTDSLQELMGLLDSEVGAIWLDLTLKDCRAEEMIESIPTIRAHCPQATLIVVSGWGDIYRDEAIKAGADAYAVKTELCGFNTKCVTSLLTKAAIEAMHRGVNAQLILDRVAAWTQKLAAA